MTELPKASRTPRECYAHVTDGNAVPSPVAQASNGYFVELLQSCLDKWHARQVDVLFALPFTLALLDSPFR